LLFAEFLRMPDYPPAEESLHRLLRSGWSTGEVGFTDSAGRYIHPVDGTPGEEKILARASTARAAWWRAVEQAAACGTLAD
jgi:hypothetical protein